MSYPRFCKMRLVEAAPLSFKVVRDKGNLLVKMVDEFWRVGPQGTFLASMSPRARNSATSFLLWGMPPVSVSPHPGDR